MAVRTALTVLALLLTTADTGHAASVYDLYRAVDREIQAWHPEAAADTIETMLDDYDDAPETHLAAARWHFHMGNYERAAASMNELERLTGRLARYEDIEHLIRETGKRTETMVKQSSERFVVYTTPGLDEMLAPFALETLEAQLDALQSDLGYRIPDNALPIRIEIYPRVLDFVAVSTLTEEEVSTSGTVALCKFNRMMIVSPRRMARGYKWRDTLAHELVHFYLSRMTRNQLPLWMHEGVAKFQERRWRSPEIGTLHPIQESILAEAQRTDTYVNFNEMMPSLAKLDSGWKTSLAFAEVTLLIKQIIEDGGMPGLRRAIEAFSRSQRDGFKELDIENLDALWQRFSGRLEQTPFNAVPGYKFIPRSVAEDPDVAEPEPVLKAAGKKFMRLGDLLRREGYWSAAITEYTKAIDKIGHTPAPLSLRLAEANLLGAKYSDAEQELKQLLVRDPDRATAHWLLGKIELFKSDPQAALDYYETAFAIAPFHREVLRGLITASEQLNDRARLKRYRKSMEIFDEHNNG